MTLRAWVWLSLALAATMAVWLLYWFTSPALQNQKTLCIGGPSAAAPSSEQQCVTRTKDRPVSVVGANLAYQGGVG